MLYQEGWGVGRIKHSLTYSGGLSRSYSRTYAPGPAFRLRRLQPLHAPECHRGRRGHSVHRAYRTCPWKNSTRSKAKSSRAASRPSPVSIMPVFPKRRFQHGAVRGESSAATRFRTGIRIPKKLPGALQLTKESPSDPNMRRAAQTILAVIFFASFLGGMQISHIVYEHLAPYFAFDREMVKRQNIRVIENQRHDIFFSQPSHSGMILVRAC